MNNPNLVNQIKTPQQTGSSSHHTSKSALAPSPPSSTSAMMMQPSSSSSASSTSSVISSHSTSNQPLSSAAANSGILLTTQKPSSAFNSVSHYQPIAQKMQPSNSLQVSDQSDVGHQLHVAKPQVHSLSANPSQSSPASASNASGEVKCDICHKVFYNKEFLAIHRANKHAMSAKQQQHQQQHHAPSSTLTNGNSSNSQSNVLFSESFCEYCNKSFCNKYFLRTHMNKAHGKTLIIENSSNNSLISNAILSNQSNEYSGDSSYDQGGFNQQISTHHNTATAAAAAAAGELGETYYASKVVDRVQCDICNKQVCNKYFLRTHKQKVHGIYDSNHNHSGRESTGSSGGPHLTANGMYGSGAAAAASTSAIASSSSSANQHRSQHNTNGGSTAREYDDYEEENLEDDEGDEEEEAFMMMQQNSGRHHQQSHVVDGYEGVVDDDEDEEFDEGEIK
jgi:hypothetical protein